MSGKSNPSLLSNKTKKRKDRDLPRRVLYATSAGLGGIGLNSVAHESVLGLHEHNILGCAVAFDNQQNDVPATKIRTLNHHPVRLLSFLESRYYYALKKRALDRTAARLLKRLPVDLFHGWSVECLHSLRAARSLGLPTVIEVPTWHRNKGKTKGRITGSERELLRKPMRRRWKESLLITRQEVMEEYDLADLILVLSNFAAETFLRAGVPEKKLFRTSRGVDAYRFTPQPRPKTFRALFVGALIKRKGVHVLLEAWNKLALPDAELFLVGHIHREIEPYLQSLATSSVKTIGFTRRAEDFFGNATVHILPSSCEGSAKSTYEAAACGLPQITTRESGDVVQDGLNGIVIPPEDPDALAAAIRRFYDSPDLVDQMGAAGRERVLSNFTWDHFRNRLLEAYRQVWAE